MAHTSESMEPSPCEARSSLSSLPLSQGYFLKRNLIVQLTHGCYLSPMTTYTGYWFMNAANSDLDMTPSWLVSARSNMNSERDMTPSPLASMRSNSASMPDVLGERDVICEASRLLSLVDGVCSIESSLNDGSSFT